MTRDDGFEHINRLARRGAIYAPPRLSRHCPLLCRLCGLALAAMVIGCAVGALIVTGVD